MDFQEIESTVGWKTFVNEVRLRNVVTSKFQKELHTLWTTSGHRIRELVADDNLLSAFLRIVLPEYSVDSITLYRGENLTRWREGRVGFCWTPILQTARMFGSGLNAIYSGGVLLQVDAGIHAIIAGPSAHSEYLGESEFTLDPARLNEVEVIETFPALLIET
jgi:hypothetical protein